ncbi:MAG: GntG family PLP-dependent aldolase [Chloroflexota bacterium]
MTPRPIELRSDTFTRPTRAMRQAMYDAEVGDDVWGEDPTVHRLEYRAAELTGKEAALFVSSGTQGNLIGVLSHTRPGDEVIVGDESHILHFEMAGAAVVGGLQLRALPNMRGRLDASAVSATIRLDDGHSPGTGCVALENTHNRCGGGVLSSADIATVADVSHAAGVPVHLDGARIFNAAVALDVPVARLTSQVDSVTFCLSKGLGAPVGSVLCGTVEFVARARRWRSLLGGGMRQAGVLAAAGLVALDTNVERLSEDNESAHRLAVGLANIDGIGIAPEHVDSNIVIFDVSQLNDTPVAFCHRLLELGVRVAPAGPHSVRAVTSYEVTAGEIETTLYAINRVSAAPVPVTV